MSATANKTGRRRSRKHVDPTYSDSEVGKELAKNYALVKDCKTLEEVCKKNTKMQSKDGESRITWPVDSHNTIRSACNHMLDNSVLTLLRESGVNAADRKGTEVLSAILEIEGVSYLASLRDSSRFEGGCEEVCSKLMNPQRSDGKGDSAHGSGEKMSACALSGQHARFIFGSKEGTRFRYIQAMKAGTELVRVEVTKFVEAAVEKAFNNDSLLRRMNNIILVPLGSRDEEADSYVLGRITSSHLCDFLGDSLGSRINFNVIPSRLSGTSKFGSYRIRPIYKRSVRDRAYSALRHKVVVKSHEVKLEVEGGNCLVDVEGSSLEFIFYPGLQDKDNHWLALKDLKRPKIDKGKLLYPLDRPHGWAVQVRWPQGTQFHRGGRFKDGVIYADKWNMRGVCARAQVPYMSINDTSNVSKKWRNTSALADIKGLRIDPAVIAKAHHYGGYLGCLCDVHIAGIKYLDETGAIKRTTRKPTEDECKALFGGINSTFLANDKSNMRLLTYAIAQAAAALIPDSFRKTIRAAYQLEDGDNFWFLRERTPEDKAKRYYFVEQTSGRTLRNIAVSTLTGSNPTSGKKSRKTRKPELKYLGRVMDAKTGEPVEASDVKFVDGQGVTMDEFTGNKYDMLLTFEQPHLDGTLVTASHYRDGCLPRRYIRALIGGRAVTMFKLLGGTRKQVSSETPSADNDSKDKDSKEKLRDPRRVDVVNDGPFDGGLSRLPLIFNSADPSKITVNRSDEDLAMAVSTPYPPGSRQHRKVSAFVDELISSSQLIAAANKKFDKAKPEWNMTSTDDAYRTGVSDPNLILMHEAARVYVMQHRSYIKELAKDAQESCLTANDATDVSGMTVECDAEDNVVVRTIPNYKKELKESAK